MESKIITLAGIDIHMPSCEKGIMLSGGADSAILLYILMKFSNEPINVYTCGSTNNSRQSPIIAYNIIRECVNRFDRKDVKQLVYFVDIKLTQEMYDVTNELTVNEKIVYTAVTNTPDDEDMKNFYHTNILYKDRNPNIKNKPYYGPSNSRYYRPFINSNKKDIFNIYKELNVLDWLFPLTVSCEESKEKPNEHCDNCWWCEERKWAFGRLL